MKDKKILEEFRKTYPEKFLPPEAIFSHIHAGDRIFIGTGCGEPQYLVHELVNYVNNNPKAFFDAELIHIWTLGVAPYTDEKFQENFRLDSFFVGDSTRSSVNRGAADYTPIFLSSVPDLFRSEMVPVDIALVQTSLPDKHGYLSLGISVDVVKSALEKAEVVVAQVNENMPRTHGDGFIHIKDIDFVLPYDEPLLEYSVKAPNDIVQKIGKYVARIIEDGSTIQVGYGLIPDEVVHSLEDKKDLGVHTELLSDGIVELMKKGVVTNQKKIHNPGKTIASFCMGSRDTYDFLDENPLLSSKKSTTPNNPLINPETGVMTASTAPWSDLTGQATAESLGGTFYSGTGGQADFMRGAVLSPGGKTILAFPSTALNDSVSRIVPVLQEGAGITLTRGDVHYMVTEYGIAYLHGKNIRERAMDLIAIAHPKFRPWLIEAARKRTLIYKDQVFIPGEKGMYPEELETYRTTKKGLEIFLRPAKITDETMLKDFFYDLSEDSMYMRFFSARKDMPHKRLQDFVVVDWSRKMEILAVIKEERERETIIALGQYELNPDEYMAEVAIVVKDEYHGMGVGKELLSYLTYIARRHGLLGFTADTLVENEAMVGLFEKMGFYTEKRREEGVYEMKMLFRKLKDKDAEEAL